MRRLFKAKTLKPKDEPIPTPIYLQHASQPVAPRILSALDAPPAPILDASEDGLSSLDMPLHRKTFWSRDRSNDHHDPLTADLTKMIGNSSVFCFPLSHLFRSLSHRNRLPGLVARLRCLLPRLPERRLCQRGHQSPQTRIQVCYFSPLSFLSSSIAGTANLPANSLLHESVFSIPSLSPTHSICSSGLSCYTTAQISSSSTQPVVNF